MSKQHLYGGQAVIEGVMIRGKHYSSIGVRNPSGNIILKTEPLSSIFTGRLRQFPLLRGIIILAETLILGMKALSYSANIQLEEEGQELSKLSIALMITFSLLFAVGIFFIAPLFAIRVFDSSISSSIVSNFIEGMIRLTIFAAYIFLIGRMADIKRVFAYHGAEHMTIHARENGEKLNIENVRKYPTAHPRCGTAFLLVVMVVAIIVFTFLGRPPIEWRILSRIILIPLIAAASYEIIRFSGTHSKNILVKFITAPNLAMQSLTTRQPDDDQIEVAIAAVTEAIKADEGKSSLLDTK